MLRRFVVCVAALLVRSAGARTNTEFTEHFILIEKKIQTDGLGGHVLRLLPDLDIALTLGLRPMCHGALLFNGKMPDAGPHASGALLGCGENAHPDTEWANHEMVRELNPRRSLVTWCNLTAAVDAATEPTLFIMRQSSFNMVKTFKFGARAAVWLREQYERVRDADPARVAALNDLWDGADGGRVAAHFRTAGWSLAPHRNFQSRFPAYIENVKHFVGVAEKTSQLLKLLVVGAAIENEDAQKLAKEQMESLLARWEGSASMYLSDQLTSEKVESVARDLDIMTSADMLIVGRGQFGATACILQKADGMHVFEHEQAMTQKQPRLPNTRIMIPATGGLVNEVRSEKDAAKPLTREVLEGLQAANPEAKCWMDFAALDKQRRKKSKERKADAERKRAKDMANGNIDPRSQAFKANLDNEQMAKIARKQMANQPKKKDKGEL